MYEWRKIWANGLANEAPSPKSGHRMAAEGMRFSWPWNGSMISLNLGVIWEISVCPLGNELVDEIRNFTPRKNRG